MRLCREPAKGKPHSHSSIFVNSGLSAFDADFLGYSRMKKKFLTATAIACVLAPSYANSQTVDADEEVTVLERLVISAGRTPIEEKKIGSAYTIIEGEQLERSQSSYIADALRQVPGFHVSRTGAFGGLTQLRVRGSEANHVLVLIDGVEVSETSQGEFDFGGLQTADVERIEVLRGPQSAFYGSDALSGVVNIITKRGERSSTSSGFQTEFGSDGTTQGSGYVRGGTDTFDGSLSISKRMTGGFNISDLGSEKDGDDNLTVNGRFNLDIAPRVTLDGTLRYVDRASDSDEQPFGNPVQDTDDQSLTEELFGSLGLRMESEDGAWQHRARIMSSSVTRESLQNNARNSGTEGTRTKAFYQISHKMEDTQENLHTLTAGYEWERETFAALTPVFNASQLTEQNRDLHSLIAEYRGEFDGQYFLNAGMRQDYNDAFQDAFTYSISGAWVVPDTGARLHASVGTGVKNPTFYEQFGFIPTSFLGNPDLKPENSFGWDIGVEQTFLEGDLVIDVTYFEQDLENEITTLFPAPTFIGTPVNQTGTSERRGVEVTASMTLSDGLTMSGNYTYLDATNPDGTRELRRPEHAGSLRFDYTSDEGHKLFAEAIFNGTMDNNNFTVSPTIRVALDSYTVVNVGGSYQLSENFELFGRIENAFDEQYEEIAGYNTQGRTFFAGIRGKF